MNSSRKHLLHLLICLFFLVSSSLIAQTRLQLSEKAQISVLTCGPGDVLYTAFGHSAIRYGTAFDCAAPLTTV